MGFSHVIILGKQVFFWLEGLRKTRRRPALRLHCAGLDGESR